MFSTHSSPSITVATLLPSGLVNGLKLLVAEVPKSSRMKSILFLPKVPLCSQVLRVRYHPSVDITNTVQSPQSDIVLARVGDMKTNMTKQKRII